MRRDLSPIDVITNLVTENGAGREYQSEDHGRRIDTESTNSCYPPRYPCSKEDSSQCRLQSSLFQHRQNTVIVRAARATLKEIFWDDKYKATILFFLCLLMIH